MEKIVGGRVWLITAVNVKRTSERMFFCSKLCKPVWRLGSDAINNRSNFHSKNCSDFSRGENYHSKIRGESSSKANYHSKNRADQNNWCHENAGKFRRNIVWSEISSKSQEFCRNSFALLLYNTVSSSIVALSFIAAGMFCRLQVEI